jgi:hypothetical protein
LSQVRSGELLPGVPAGRDEIDGLMALTQLPDAISTLLVEIFGGITHPLAHEMADWMVTSRRFRVFAEVYRDKIRKKARSTPDREGLRDLRCELATAYLLLQEPRCTVQYELLNAGKQRAPDFTVLLKDNLPFHVEVTRLRARLRDASTPRAGEDTRLAHTLCGKLGQMQPGATNILIIWTDGEPYAEARVVATARALLLRASNKDDAYFAWHGFSDARDFLHQYQRLSGLLLIDDWRRGINTQALLWENNQARRPIPRAVLNVLSKMGS